MAGIDTHIHLPCISTSIKIANIGPVHVWESGCFVSDPVLTGNLSAPYLQYRMMKILEGWSEACEMSFFFFFLI